MQSVTVQRIEANMGQFSLADQLHLMDRLARRIREQTKPLEKDRLLAAMAEDPEVQRELREMRRINAV